MSFHKAVNEVSDAVMLINAVGMINIERRQSRWTYSFPLPPVTFLMSESISFLIYIQLNIYLDILTGSDHLTLSGNHVTLSHLHHFLALGFSLN